MKRERPQPAPAEWRSRQAMQLYAAGEPIARIASLVGWSEGRVRKVLREAGVVIADGGGVASREDHEEGRRRLLDAGWESKLRAGLVVWRRPDGRGSWYTEDVAMEVLEAIEDEGREGGS